MILQGYYNEAAQTAKLNISNNTQQYPPISQEYKSFHQLCRNVWKRLSKLERFAVWDDYRTLTRRTLTDTEREQLNQTFERFIDLIPPMNLTGIITFNLEFLDDYYSSETKIYIDLLPRNMEGRA